MLTSKLFSRSRKALASQVCHHLDCSAIRSKVDAEGMRGPFKGYHHYHRHHFQRLNHHKRQGFPQSHLRRLLRPPSRLRRRRVSFSTVSSGWGDGSTSSAKVDRGVDVQQEIETRVNVNFNRKQTQSSASSTSSSDEIDCVLCEIEKARSQAEKSGVILPTSTPLKGVAASVSVTPSLKAATIPMPKATVPNATGRPMSQTNTSDPTRLQREIEAEVRSAKEWMLVSRDQHMGEEPGLNAVILGPHLRGGVPYNRSSNAARPADGDKGKSSSGVHADREYAKIEEAWRSQQDSTLPTAAASSVSSGSRRSADEAYSELEEDWLREGGAAGVPAAPLGRRNNNELNTRWSRPHLDPETIDSRTGTKFRSPDETEGWNHVGEDENAPPDTVTDQFFDSMFEDYGKDLGLGKDWSFGEGEGKVRRTGTNRSKLKGNKSNNAESNDNNRLNQFKPCASQNANDTQSDDANANHPEDNFNSSGDQGNPPNQFDKHDVNSLSKPHPTMGVGWWGGKYHYKSLSSENKFVNEQLAHPKDILPKAKKEEPRSNPNYQPLKREHWYMEKWISLVTIIVGFGAYCYFSSYQEDAKKSRCAECEKPEKLPPCKGEGGCDTKKKPSCGAKKEDSCGVKKETTCGAKKQASCGAKSESKCGSCGAKKPETGGGKCGKCGK